MDLTADVPRAGASPSTGSGHDPDATETRSGCVAFAALMSAFLAGMLATWLTLH